MNTRKRFNLACLLLCGLFASGARAQDLQITELEFASWPQYCQARYVTVPPGSSSQWAQTYPQQIINASRKQLGAATFERVHHYCNGLVWIARSRFEPDRKTKLFYLEQAKGEVIFTYTGLPRDSPMIAPTYITLAQICSERGESACALDNLQKAIEVRPDDSAPYSALAVFYRKQKKLNLAKETLLQGDKAMEGKSAEIHYNLGLIYLELGEIDSALERAHAAYAMGYPLPGLKTRLEKIGKWTEPTAPAPGSSEPD